MMEATILGPWVRDADGHTIPQVKRDHTIAYYTDITDQPVKRIIPEPNVFVCRIRCEAATLARIEAGPVYEVLTSEEM